MTINDLILKNRHFLEQFENGVTKDVFKQLRQAQFDILKKLESKTMNEITRAHYEAVLAESISVLKERYEEINDVVKNAMSDTAQIEYNTISNAIRTDAGLKAIAENAPLMGLPGEALNSILTNPIGGYTLSNWVSKLESNTLEGIKGSLSRGLILGHGMNDIARDIKNTFGISATQAKVLTRTAIMDASNKALQQCYNDNSQYIETYRFVATLDHRTCLICAKLDGKTGDIPKLRKSKVLKAEKEKMEEKKIEKEMQIPQIPEKKGPKINILPNVTHSYSQFVKESINEIPLEIRERMAKYGIEFDIGRLQSEIDPSLKGKQPMGWVKGASYDNCCGLFNPNTNKICLAERVTKIGREGSFCESEYRVKGAVFHESGHALDVILGKEFMPGKEFSDFSTADVTFRNAYLEDLDKIKMNPKLIANYAYFITNPNCLKEIFAESIACNLGQSSSYITKEFMENWPSTNKYINIILKGIKK